MALLRRIHVEQIENHCGSTLDLPWIHLKSTKKSHLEFLISSFSEKGKAASGLGMKCSLPQIAVGHLVLLLDHIHRSVEPPSSWRPHWNVSTCLDISIMAMRCNMSFKILRNARCRPIAQSRWVSHLSQTKGADRYVERASLYCFTSKIRRRIHFPGAVDSVFTTKLQFNRPAEKPAMPTYRIIDSDGQVIDRNKKPDVSREEVLKWYHDMLTGMLPLLKHKL